MSKSSNFQRPAAEALMLDDDIGLGAEEVAEVALELVGGCWGCK